MSMLKYYFGVRLHSAPRVAGLDTPSKALEVSCYLFSFWIAVNYPDLQSAMVYSFVQVNFLPRYFDIRKLRHGEVAWRFSRKFVLGRKRCYEEFHADTLIR